MGNIYASSIAVSGASSASPGNTVNVSVGGSFTGKVNVTVSNGYGNKSIWVENNTVTVPVTVGSSGTTTITAVSDDGTSDSNGNNLGVIRGSKSIQIVQPTPAPTPTPTTPSNNTNTNSNSATKTATKSASSSTTSTKSRNAYLSKLQINQEGLTPNFNKNKTSYAVTVGENVNDLKVTAVAEDSKSKVAISGNTGLKNGDNKVYITVTAQDGTKKVYTITVTKTGDANKSNSYLQNLIVENATLSPEFSKEIFEYDCGTVGKSVETLKILAFGENENVKIDITGNDKLSEGDNKIIVKVTSEDGTTTKEYVITVKKDSNIVEENNIEEINALQDTDNDNNFFNKLFKKIKNNWLVCLMYIVILVQFIEIVYLYKNQNSKKDTKGNKETKDNILNDGVKKNKRMRLDKEFKQNKKKRKANENLDDESPKKRNGANKFFDDK
jgi:uncharacterized protein YrzB (UPF0473 family)